MSDEKSTTTAPEATEDRAYADALNAQFETFCGLTELRDMLNASDYSIVRAAVAAKRDIRFWRRFAAAATVLAKGGMAATDIADYGLPMVERLGVGIAFGNEEHLAGVIAGVATEFGFAGEDLPKVEALITYTSKAMREGF